MRQSFTQRRERSLSRRPGSASADRGRKQPPPVRTHAEEFYYTKQMHSKTPMVVKLQDGEELRGWIEWYDETCIKVHRTNGPNLLVFKTHIKYIYKDPEEAAQE